MKFDGYDGLSILLERSISELVLAVIFYDALDSAAM
jgi:hypothetical protein